jgi:heme-degrading monooxygenase HmoA
MRASVGLLDSRPILARVEAIPMHVQVATYKIDALSDEEFIDANQEFASMMNAVSGLLAKVWLKAPDGRVYGGVYLWRDREAYEDFIRSDLWASVLSDDSLTELETQDFAVMEELTKATQPGLPIFETAT